MRRLWAMLAVVTACAGAGDAWRIATLGRITESPGARELAREAPGAWAEVLRVSVGAQGQDGVTETALAMDWGLTQARAAQARRRALVAERRRTEASAEASRMEQQAEVQRAEIERAEAARAQAARARAAASAPDGVVLVERVAVATDLRQQAGLMLAAARMLGASGANGAAGAEVAARIETAEVAARGPDVAALWTSAGRAYAAAEALLRATRTAASGARTDSTALYSELSSGGAMDPHRDPRGVVAVLRGMFSGAELSPVAVERVGALARVLSQHTDLRVRVEAFVGGASRAAAESTARAQAQSLAAALERAGVAHDRIGSDGLWRSVNGARSDDRVEVVLVLSGES